MLWSGQRDLNPRPSRWQRDALPLSYARKLINSIDNLFIDVNRVILKLLRDILLQIDSTEILIL